MRKETRAPRISITRHGVPLLARMPAIRVSQGHSALCQLTVRDDRGNPVDLSDYGVADADGDGSSGSSLSADSESSSESSSSSGITLEVRVVESVSRTCVFKVDAISNEPEEGEVQFELSCEQTRCGGIFIAELVVLDETDCVVFGYTFYLAIDPAPGAGQMTGPPMEAEIRLHMRDSMPAENFLIDEIDFDLAEISMAIYRPVQYWNEALPPLRRRYNTESFPFRYHWLEGIVSQLCLIAAEHYRRNRLAHSAGGVTVDDLNREQNYQIEGARRWDLYREWVRANKVSQNIAGGYGIIGMSYPG